MGRITSLFNRWKNYGFDKGTLDKFQKDIDLRNLKALRAFCLTYTILNFLFLFLEIVFGDSLVALGYIFVSFCIILGFAKYFNHIIASNKPFKYTAFFVTLFSSITYGCTIFWSSYVQSDDYGVFTVCMLFFLPFVVNERPVKLFLQLSFVVLISSILSFLIKEPFYAISDMIHAFVAAMAGYMVSYTKNRQVLEELITTNKLEKANAELEYLNTVDVLTGIYNRKKIFSILDTLKVTSKEEEKVLSCAILDLDNFKTINDTYGHPVGDRILKAAGVIFKEIADTHQEVSVGRIGGEEFMLLGMDLKKEEFAEICCEIKQKIYGLTIKGKQNEELFRASVSCGFCVLNGMESSQLYHYADKALYYAKNHGKNCIWYYLVEEDEYFNYM